MDKGAMSEKELKDQAVAEGEEAEGTPANQKADKAAVKSKDERLAEALRANLRRRKSAAKARKDG
ncbi:hypothetical protein [Labrenzia sp. VG12]|uniref:hypothetical protein n=1 Tax=Labrenzia sp. VG12 TaxID=2021862 RepID=UPI000B8C08D0|nr:hypothetical protein [Labrenzia sp. VG12]ASP36501.1 hypothetical protein CHH27_27335 [Labrenzia sp. VG12]